MNTKDSLDILMGRLGRSDPDIRAKCLLEMRLAQEALEQSETLPWFLMGEKAEATTDANERRLKLPPDFLRESEEQALLYVASDGTKKDLPKEGYDELLAHYGQAVGPPEAYAIRAEYLMFFPIPDQEYAVEFSSYYGRQVPPEDTTASENAWFKNAADLVIARAGLMIATNYLKDAELMSTFDGLLGEAKKRLFHLEVAREEANRSRDMEED